MLYRQTLQDMETIGLLPLKFRFSTYPRRLFFPRLRLQLGRQHLLPRTHHKRVNPTHQPMVALQLRVQVQLAPVVVVVVVVVEAEEEEEEEEEDPTTMGVGTGMGMLLLLWVQPSESWVLS
jgi:hypothetical protein